MTVIIFVIPQTKRVLCKCCFGFFFHAAQDLKEEIDIRLSRVQDIKYEPRLLAEDDSRLLQLETQGTLSHCVSVRGHQRHCPVLVPLQRVVPWG